MVKSPTIIPLSGQIWPNFTKPRFPYLNSRGFPLAKPPNLGFLDVFGPVFGRYKFDHPRHGPPAQPTSPDRWNRHLWWHQQLRQPRRCPRACGVGG